LWQFFAFNVNSESQYEKKKEGRMIISSSTSTIGKCFSKVNPGIKNEKLHFSNLFPA
jgi:hypothetical protein